MNSVTKFIKQQRYLKSIADKTPPKPELHKKKKRVKRELDKLADRVRGKDYQNFLRSEYWKRVKEIVLQRDSNACVICHSEENLHVHHDTYKHHFNEHNHLEILITLCGNCHKDYHYNIDANFKKTA